MAIWVASRSVPAPTSHVEMVHKDRRRTRRMLLRLPVWFAGLRDLPGRMERYEGVTHDISSKGIYVVTRNLPLRGAKLRFEVLLPPIPGVRIAMWMEGRGYVTRVEKPKKNRAVAGFSVTIKRFCLRPRGLRAKELSNVPRPCSSDSDFGVEA